MDVSCRISSVNTYLPESKVHYVSMDTCGNEDTFLPHLYAPHIRQGQHSARHYVYLAWGRQRVYAISTIFGHEELDTFST